MTVRPFRFAVQTGAFGDLDGPLGAARQAEDLGISHYVIRDPEGFHPVAEQLT